MKLRIGETEYDYQAALDKAPLGALYDLKVQGGPGRLTIARALNLFDDGLRAEEGETAEEKQARAEAMEEDPRVLLGLAGLVYLSKRWAGEPYTWVEAQQVSWDDLQFIIEPADIEAAIAKAAAEQPDPQKPSGGRTPAGGATKNGPGSPKKTAATKPSTGTSKTSKRRSTSTS